ncbi:zinc finger protein 385B [Aplochiton taeniatus]
MDPVQKAVINHTFGVSLPPRKKQVISCNICQLRFNSDSQAEAHYRGSKHAKKLKAQDGSKNKNKTLPAAGDSCPSQASGASNTSQANGANNTSQANATSNTSQDNGASNTIHANVASNTFHANAASNTSSLTLAACDAANRIDGLPCREVSSTPVACHFSSSTPPSASTPPRLNPQPTSTLSPTRGPQTRTPASGAPTLAAPSPAPQAQASLLSESEEEKAKKLLYCSLCKVAVNSLSQLEAHNTGSKHKTMLEAGSGTGPIKAYPRVGAKLKVQSSMAAVKGSGLQNKTFHCQICDVHVNSEIQLKQHISSRRHKDRVAGKPMKPKYSPYNKQQRSTTTMTAKLALQKDMVTPISPGFLSSPFCPSSVSSLSLPPSPLSPSLSLAPRPSPSLFQASFLRAAPGPIRASSGSILFAPY